MNRATSSILYSFCAVTLLGCSGGTAPTVAPIGPAPGTDEYKQMTRTVGNDPTFKGQAAEDPANKKAGR